MKHHFRLLLSLILIHNLSIAQWKQTTGPGGGNVYSLVCSGENLFAATSGGIFRSTNNGASWAHAGMSEGPPLALNPNGSNGSVLFAGGNSVSFSIDNGTTWTAVNMGLPYYPSVQCFAFRDTNIFAGTEFNGIYSGLPAYGIDVYSFLASATNLFAGTNLGVYSRPLSEFTTAVKIDREKLPESFSLSQNYPNPFNPLTTISFDIPSRSFVSLKIFDILGREVSTIVSEELPAGSYSRQWNAANMASGVYFYRVHAGTYLETKRLLLLK